MSHLLPIPKLYLFLNTIRLALRVNFMCHCKNKFSNISYTTSVDIGHSDSAGDRKSLVKLYSLQARFAYLRCAACGDFVSAESPCGRLELLNLAYFGNLFTLYKYCKQKLTNNFSNRSENKIFEVYIPENSMSTVGS